MLGGGRIRGPHRRGSQRPRDDGVALPKSAARRAVAEPAAALGRGVVGEAVGDGAAVGAFPDTVIARDARGALDTAADLAGEDTGPGEVAGCPEAGVQVLTERAVDAHRLGAAAGRRRGPGLEGELGGLAPATGRSTPRHPFGPCVFVGHRVSSVAAEQHTTTHPCRLMFARRSAHAGETRRSGPAETSGARSECGPSS